MKSREQKPLSLIALLAVLQKINASELKSGRLVLTDAVAREILKLFPNMPHWLKGIGFKTDQIIVYVKLGMFPQTPVSLKVEHFEFDTTGHSLLLQYGAIASTLIGAGETLMGKKLQNWLDANAWFSLRQKHSEVLIDLDQLDAFKKLLDIPFEEGSLGEVLRIDLLKVVEGATIFQGNIKATEI